APHQGTHATRSSTAFPVRRPSRGAMTGYTAQRTIRTATRCSGVALHSGEPVSMTLLPAPANSGIVFRRIDLGGVEIAASWRNVIEAPMCTALADGAGNRVA